MGGAACAAARLRLAAAAVGAALLLLLRLPGAVALHAISCVGDNSSCRTGDWPYDYSACECGMETHVCPAGEDCVLTCSGNGACGGLTITGPSGYTLTILCEGSDRETCRLMEIHAEASAAVSFACAGTGGGFDRCGASAKVFCGVILNCTCGLRRILTSSARSILALFTRI